jgi:4-hydroxythreonine-4-phosphate dehydrogenase
MTHQPTKKRPLIGITMGDPAGVGPEIIIKALADPLIYRICRPLVLGDLRALSQCQGIGPDTVVKEANRPHDGLYRPGHIDLLPLSSLEEPHIVPGKPNVRGGKAMVQYIEKAVHMARKKEIEAVVTCPINKALMQEAGYRYEGHTQLLAHLNRTSDYVMMLAGEKLRVSLVTIHCALRSVSDLLTGENILKTISITHRALRKDFGIKRPKLAVAALNPHAGEGGLFGNEEKRIIEPALETAGARGYPVDGPLPADTLFFKAVSGQFDAVICMYHDQGLIPLKLLHFSDGVNVTLGLPIVRTSVDHGTAYDIAGKGIADPSSLKAAINMAAKIAINRRENKLEIRNKHQWFLGLK